MLNAPILLFASLVIVWVSAGVVVNSSIKIAKALKISEVFIGLTVLSIGTSLPEIFTHIIASIDILKGVETSGIAVGTNIGSNIFQITMILGISAFFMKIRTTRNFLKQDYFFMLGSIILLFLMSLNGFISQTEGIVLALLYIGYLLFLAKQEKLVVKIEKRTEYKHYLLHTFLIITGIGVLLYSTSMVVNSAVILQGLWGVSGSFIGTIIIGVTSALPELTTALRALLKGSHGISLGTLVGSNITNPLFALGMGAGISGYTIEKVILWYDLPFWFFASCLALGFLWTKKDISKKEAVILALTYVLYVVIRIKYFL